MTKRAIFLILFLLGLVAVPVLSYASEPTDNEYILRDVISYSDAPADHNRVFYEIFVGSFSDSNGDGIGDLQGIINRLDYLNDGDPTSGKSLGVEGIWLTPVFSSPSYHKYDVTDYYTIDEAFGSMADLQELIRQCHERNMLVIIDLPINHTGIRNKWFVNFTNAHILHNTQNIYYDFYTWLPENSSIPAGRHFSNLYNAHIMYESNFSSDMPELNYDNSFVRETVLDIAAYYLELGIDGFRFDAAKYIYYGDHTASAAFWDWFIGELRKIKPDIYTVSEVWDSDGITSHYQKAGNCFNFTLSQAEGLIAVTAKGGDVNRLTSYTEQYINSITVLNPSAMNISFIANHDTDRCAGYLTVASGYAMMAANLYLLSPGSPFIYYGEEIGLRGSRGGANTDANRRLAMLWGDGDTIEDPVGTTYDRKKQTPYSVSDLIGKQSSLYNHYKKLIMIRNANPEIARGTYHALPFENTKVGGFSSEYNGKTVAVIHNTTQSTKTVDLKTVTDIPFNLISAAVGQADALLDGSILTIGSQTSVVLRCEP